MRSSPVVIRPRLTALACVLVLGAFSACGGTSKSSSGARPTSGGSAGHVTDESGRGGSSEGGEGGESHQGGTAGRSAGGTAGRGGSSDGGADAGGSSGRGAAAGAGGEPGSAGQVQNGGGMGTGLPGPTLLGPMVANQAPIVVPAELQAMDITNAPFDIVVTTDGGLVLVWYRGGVTYAAKLDPDNHVIWSRSIVQYPESMYVHTLLAGLDGEVFLGADAELNIDPIEPYAGGSADAVVGKLTKDGDVAWLRQWGTKQLEWTTTLVLMEDGSVIAAGVCSEQVAGAPAENFGGPTLVRYDVYGGRDWLRQHSPSASEYLRIDNLRDGLFLGADGAGLIFTANSFRQRRVDAQGFETGSVDPPETTSGPLAFGSIHRVPGDDLLSLTSSRTDASSPTAPALAAFGLDGSLKWYRQAQVESAVIDQAAGTVWTGEWLSPGLGDYMVVGADGVYVLGLYVSEYENGPTEQLFSNVVAKFDFSGNRLWFQLFRLQNQNSPTWVSHYLELGLDGNPVYALADNNATPPYIMRLRAEDGTIIQP